MKVLLLTIAIGEKYIQEYNILFKPSQEAYALKHGYDFKIITDYLDKTVTNNLNTILFNKYLICDQKWSSQYDFIVYVDADVYIRINAPPIHTFIENECIGVIDEYTQPTKEKRITFQKKMGWETSATDYYKLCDFDLETEMVINGGVLVFQPKYHNEFLKSIYTKYVSKSLDHPRGFHFEQSCTGYEIQKEKNYTVLDNKFNAIWLLTDSHEETTFEEFIDNNYFIHFAAHHGFGNLKKFIKKIKISK